MRTIVINQSNALLPSTGEGRPARTPQQKVDAWRHVQPSLAPQQLYQTRRFDSSLTSTRTCWRITYGGLVFFFFYQFIWIIYLS